MITTPKGEFESFAHLRLAYLKVHDERPPVVQYFNTDEWDDETLHISELGKCMRQQMLRLAGAEKKWESPDKQANDALMFWQGNMIHALTVGAADWAGILIDFEQPLPGLPDGWSGHYDLAYRPHFEQDYIAGWDGKTVRSNNFNYWYEWPKDKDVAQARGYLHFQLLGIVKWGIEYIDRGGANTPWLFEIDPDPDWVRWRMTDLEHWRAELPELPPPLVPELKLTYRKDRNLPTYSISKLMLANSWQCEWCPYHWASGPDWRANEDSPCKPQMVKQEIGRVTKGHLDIEESYRDQAADWLRDKVKSYLDPRADVTVE